MYEKFEELYRQFEEEWWWFEGRRNLVSNLCSRFRFEENVKVLEIGCGTGRNAEIFKSYYGIDISVTSLRIAYSRGLRNLARGTALKLPFKSASFDLILLLDVLEHLDDDYMAVKEAHRVLKSDGILIILSPAFMFLWSDHDIVFNHKRRYKKGEIEEITTKNGFIIERISYWNFFLFIPVLLKRKIETMHSQTRPKSDLIELPKIINRPLHILLKIENLLISKGVNLPVGVSILCIGKKWE